MTSPDAGSGPPDTRPPGHPPPPPPPPPRPTNSGTRGLQPTTIGAGAGSTPGQSSPRAAGPAPDLAARVAELAEDGGFTLPMTARPPEFVSGSAMRRALQLSLERRSR